MALKTSEIREQFPFLKESVNGHPLVYLDNAASSQKPERVIRRMSRFLESEYANVHRGIHLLSERATAAYENARVELASLLNAERPEEIAFTRGTTEAVNLVANTWGRKHIGEGDTILLTEMEHHSNLLPWLNLAREAGAKVEYVPVTENGAALDMDVAKTLLAKHPKLFAFVHVPNTLGLENPVAELCRIAREAGVTTFVDGAQSVGHQPVDVRALGCDFLACSSHKMCGPSGIGALWGRYELLSSMPPWQYGGEMVDRAYYDKPATFREPPARFEAGTPAILEAAGWTEAIRFLRDTGLEDIREHSIALANDAASKLRGIEGLRIFGPVTRQSGIVAFSIEGVHAHDVSFFANERGLALRAGHHCAQPLMRKLGSPSSSRASFYLYNTAREVEALVAIVRDAVAFFR
ncbi:MAG: SufS family cysteine desulfurase [Verrucomicrobiaceae bacterium]|nr:MAG: SufS family cysteine desulfurase [Verrucomicrobiaceae bacterium]